MKAYIASTFDLIEVIEELLPRLSEIGIEITCKWWKLNFRESLGLLTDKDWYNNFEVNECLYRDLKGIDEADIFILVARESVKFNGALIELGYALAKGKRVFIYGKVGRSVMFCGIPQIQDIDILIKELQCLM